MRSETIESIPRFLERPGPTVLVGPNAYVGLSRQVIDLLCRFAEDPGAPEFQHREVFTPDKGAWIQWPWPLPPGLENPIREDVKNEEQWIKKRWELIKARKKELRM